MRLVFVRHGDPDYSIDSLTPKGFEEVAPLKERIAGLQPAECYVSPLGRAKDTAAAGMKALDLPLTELPWLHEFKGKCIRPGEEKESICWDWLPGDWTQEPRFYDAERWIEPFEGTNVKEEFQGFCRDFDAFLAEHGYVRDGRTYRVEKENHDTIVFFCHYAITVAAISHLLGLSPMILWHGFMAAPSSLTILNTEERRQGIASFRMSSYGDVSHLYADSQQPAFAGRFCECYSDETRH